MGWRWREPQLVPHLIYQQTGTRDLSTSGGDVRQDRRGASLRDFSIIAMKSAFELDCDKNMDKVTCYPNFGVALNWSQTKFFK